MKTKSKFHRAADVIGDTEPFTRKRLDPASTDRFPNSILTYSWHTTGTMPLKTKASKHKSSQQPDKAAPGQPVLPNWPPLAPLASPDDLSLTTLLSDQILTVSNFWTSSLCKNYVAFLKTLPLTTTPGKPKRGDAVRVNDRYQIQDAAFAERLWRETGLREMVLKPVVDGEEMSEEAAKQLWGGEVLGLNANIRIYRYSKGQFFDQHCTFYRSTLYLNHTLRSVQTTTPTTSLSRTRDRQPLSQQKRPGRCCYIFPRLRQAAKAARRSSTQIHLQSARLHRLRSSPSSKSAWSCSIATAKTASCTRAEK